MPFAPEDRTIRSVDDAGALPASDHPGCGPDHRFLSAVDRAGATVVRADQDAAPANADTDPLRLPSADRPVADGRFPATVTPRGFIGGGAAGRCATARLDVGIAVGSRDAAPCVARAMPFPGRGDVRRLVGAVRREGARAPVAPSLRTDPPVASGGRRCRGDTVIGFAAVAATCRRAGPVASPVDGA